MRDGLILEYTNKEGLYLLSKDGMTIGTILSEDDNSAWDCGVESCRGTHYIVKWLDDDETTYVCGKGLKWLKENIAQIL